MNQLLPLTESEALFAPFQDPWLSRQMDFALVPAGGVGFRNEINWDIVYVKWDACPLGEVAGGLEIPIIAANLQRLILPRQSQVWAVLRKADTAQRLAYSLAATFLGRMCLSGEVHDLSPAHWKLAVSAMELYRRVYPIIRDGYSTFHGETGKSWRHPQGWQAVLRTSKSGKHALLVAHTFGKPFPKSVEIPLPGAGWKVEEAWPAKAGLKSSLKGKRLNLELAVEFRATVTTLRRS